MQIELKRERIRDQIRTVVRELIVTGDLGSGQHLDEIGLAARIGASRTPLREALISLEEEGLVQSRPNHGFSVTMLDARLVREIYPILGALEAAAVELGGDRLVKAAPQLADINARLSRKLRPRERHALDFKFHRALTEHCENGRLLQSIAQHWNHARRIDGGERRGMADLKGSCTEHGAIVEEIGRGRLGKAAQLVREHWLRGIDVVTGWMESVR